MTEAQMLKAEFKDYAKALKRVGEMALMIEDIAKDLQELVYGLERGAKDNAGAHCIKCGNAILADEDSICGNCI